MTENPVNRPKVGDTTSRPVYGFRIVPTAERLKTKGCIHLLNKKVTKWKPLNVITENVIITCFIKSLSMLLFALYDKVSLAPNIILTSTKKQFYSVNVFVIILLMGSS
jgi:hypothetical protein